MLDIHAPFISTYRIPAYLQLTLTPTCDMLCQCYTSLHAPVFATDHKTLLRYGPGRPTFLGDFTDPPPYLKGEFPGASPYPCNPVRHRGGRLL